MRFLLTPAIHCRSNFNDKLVWKSYRLAGDDKNIAFFHGGEIMV